MDIIGILSTVILLVTIGTITVAVAAYAALKLRDRRKPKPKAVGVPGHDAVADFQPVFLKRYIPPAHAPNHSAAESAKTD
jgi:hypothetical protein